MQQPTPPQKPTLRIYLGSCLLFVCIFLSVTVAGVLILITTPLPFRVRYKIGSLWCWLVLWMTRFFCGLGFEIEGLENIRNIKTAIVLSNHQSAWETLALRCFLPTQSILLKRSLTWLPIWGWALACLKPVAIDRKKQRAALSSLLSKGTAALNDGLWMVIFPEGTRTAAGEVKKFSAGGALLAERSGFPVIPIAHNAGNFWPRYSFLKYPGTIRIKIGSAIETRGRKASEINTEAENWVRQAVNDLNSEA
jgi:1-acyl-sn-glycerol-3-phosphate acyltransferase